MRSSWISEVAALFETIGGTLRQSEVVPSVVEEFRTMFEAEFSYVCRSLRRCGIRDADVEDLAHDVFLAAHASHANFDARRAVKPWLFGICFRIASHHKRRAGYKREQLGDAEDAEDTTPLADVHIEAEERRQLVLRVLDTLDDERRAVLVMHDLDEISMRDIADVLGIPVFTAYSRLRIAREQFAAAARRLQHRREKS